MMASTLSCAGLSLPDDRDPLGVWDLHTSRMGPGPSHGEAYAASAAAEAPPEAREGRFNGLIWTVAHPAGVQGRRASREARSMLRGQRVAVERRDRALDLVAPRLTALSLMPAYDTRLGEHEAALLAEVTALQTSWGRAGIGSVAMSMAGEGAAALSHRQMFQQVERMEEARQLLVQLRRLVYHWAWIETEVGGGRIALTTVDWGGDYQTTWLERVTQQQMDLHLDAVRLALASRHALLRLITVAVTGALELALKASVPGGQILLIPAVYRYVRDLLEELGDLPVSGLPSWRAEPTVA